MELSVFKHPQATRCRVTIDGKEPTELGMRVQRIVTQEGSMEGLAVGVKIEFDKYTDEDGEKEGWFLVLGENKRSIEMQVRGHIQVWNHDKTQEIVDFDPVSGEFTYVAQ